MTDAALAPPTAASPGALQAEIAAARADLVASLGELRAATTPPALAKRAGRSALGWFTDEYGGVRPERVVIAVGVVVGFVVVRRVLRRR